MSLLNADQEVYAERLAKATGLHLVSVIAWLLCEEPASRSPISQGHNWLNLLHQSVGRTTGFSGVRIVGWSEAGFARFGSVDDAIREAGYWVNRMGNYAGIRASRGKPALEQVAAIAASPWDAGHYGDGHTITRILVDTVLKVHPAPEPPRWPMRWTVSYYDQQLVQRVAVTRHPVLWATNHWRTFRRGPVRFTRR